MKLQRKFIAIVLFLSCFSGFSQINVTTNFRVITNLPIDSRLVVADLTARDAINSLYRYEGMLVYVVSDQTNYQLVGGIANANWQTLSFSGSSYSAGAGLTLSGNSFSHSPHTGDVTGTTSLTISAIQGRVLSTVTPTSGDVLTWNGSAWAPTVALGTQYASGTGIIQTGTTFSADNTSPIWNANKLNGTSISTTSPSSSEVLKWNGSEWIPAADNNTTYTSGTGIVLAGNTFSANNASAIWNANQLNGTSISTIAPSSNEILKWNGTEWIPAIDNNTTYTSGTGIVLAGNTFSANNTSAIWNANQLNGTSISTIGPASNEILKWNGSEWIPAEDNNTTYTSGTGIVLSGNTFSADNTSPIWNANKLNGTSISTTSPASTEVLKWNGSEWIPAADNNTTYSSGTGIILTGSTFSADNTNAIWNAQQLQGTNVSASIPTNNQILKYSAGTWVASDEVSYSAGTGISLSGNTFSHISHTGDANGSTNLTVTGLQGRSITTTSPSSGNILKWNGSLWALGYLTDYDSFNGNRTVTRSGIPNVNVATSATVTDFLNAYFFPFVPATLSIDGSIIYEIGTTNTISISGSRTSNQETVFSNGRLDITYPSTVTIFNFGSASSYSTTDTFTPIQGTPSSLELRYVAYQAVGNNGSPTTINSSTKIATSVYPYFHGVTTLNFTSGGTATYTGLTKVVESKSNKTKTFNGVGYMYFCYPASYGLLTNIMDQNDFQFLSNFTVYSQNVNSVGLVNNWSEPYYIYISNSVSTSSNYNFQFIY